MPEQFVTQDQLLLGKIEATPGTEETPTAAANAIKSSSLVWNPGLEVDQNADEHTGSLDVGAPVVLGGGAGFTFGVRLRGSGAAGTAPEWGVLIRACGFTEVVSGAADTGTAQAGAATSITLAAGASAVDDFYNGMPIDLTGGTGSGQENIIVDYVGSTKVATVANTWATNPDATTTYSVPANVLYKPASADLDTITLWGYQNGNESATQSLLRKAVGAMGTFTVPLAPRVVPLINFTFQGLLPASPTQVTRPTGVVFDSGADAAYKSALAVLGGATVKFSQLDLQLGANIAQSADPGTAFGMDRASIIRRTMTGTLTRYLKNLSGQNIFDDFQAGNAKVLATRWGPTPGSRFAVTMPAVRYTGNPEGDTDGFASSAIPFSATGADTGMYLCAF